MKLADFQKRGFAHWTAGLALVLALAGCASTPPKGRADLLDFLADGKTTKEEAITALGQPSGRFDSERILTYRLGFEPRNQGYYLVEREAGSSAWPAGSQSSGWPTWSRASFSLVLVFNEMAVLEKHSLVKVNQ